MSLIAIPQIGLLDLSEIAFIGDVYEADDRGPLYDVVLKGGHLIEYISDADYSRARLVIDWTEYFMEQTHVL